MTNPIKVANLCENTVHIGKLIGEHGLALLIEGHGKKILLDTGAGMTLMHNVHELGIDLQDLDAVVLSHGHHDHTSGLVPLLKKNNSIPVYAHPEIFGEKYACHNKKDYEYIGIPWSRQELARKGAQLHLSKAPVDLGSGITLTGEIPRLDNINSYNETLYLKTESGMVKDPLLDDQAIIIEGSRGLIVLLGCAHAGLINTLHYVRKLTGQDKLYAILGGTHLFELPAVALKDTVEQLRDFGLQKIAPCHCTGMKAYFALYQAFGDKYLEHRAGSVFYL